ncbi:MAG: N-acetylneuraminate synthase family protein [Candidatus Staskawiczbacteria bacterium]|jgi:N-acetylneuraminate synthase
MINFRDLKKPYLIAEIGINHNGDLQVVKRLIDAAFACQWDCVKFQKREPDISVPGEQKNVIKDTPWGQMTYLEYKKRIEFGKEDYDYIDEYCREKPISWTASVWDIPSLDFILKYNTPFIKIPSAKITDQQLVEAVAKSGRPVLVSTGMSTLEEIDKAVDVLKDNNTNFVLMHCNSAYPAPHPELNLNCIKTLKERYNCPVGYSGHEYDLEPSVYAVVLGVKIIERHITTDHNMWGTDQTASLEVVAMDRLKKRIIDIDEVLGSGEKIITKSEEIVRKKLRG